MAAGGLALLGIFLTLITLCFAQTTPIQDFYPREHICYKLRHGRFDLIDFKSFTFLVRPETIDLLIFEGTKKYRYDVDLIKHDSINITGNMANWYDDELRTVVALAEKETQLKGKPIQAVYLLYMGDYKWHHQKLNADKHEKILGFIDKLRWDNTKLAVNIFANDIVYLYDIFQEQYPERYMAYPNPYARPMAIVQGQDGFNGKQDRSADGYVVHKDIFNNREEFIIYDLNVDYPSLHFEMHEREKVPKSKQDKAPYYYLEKNANPAQVVLLHRSLKDVNKPSDPARQLFHSQPLGFKRKDTVYLFDTLLGCVYIIDKVPASLNQTYFKSNTSLTLKRTNVPYEKFFVCNQPLIEDWPYDSKRCETTIYSPVINEVINGTSTLATHWVEDWGWILMAVVVGVVVISALFVGGYCVFKGSTTRANQLTATKLLEAMSSHKKSSSSTTKPTPKSKHHHKKSPVDSHGRRDKNSKKQATLSPTSTTAARSNTVVSPADKSN